LRRNNLKIKEMNDIKSWIQSKTIWAILVTITPVLSKMVGFDIDATLTDVLTIIGAGAAIFFRVKAKASLK
jgi:hypothetical protein